MQNVIEQTGELFGDLWHRYDEKLFRESVELFSMRFRANGFDLDWFQGKRCLDAGCGGGRYSIAMALLGAEQVTGADISSSGLEDARQRAASIPNVDFAEASVLDLPFGDETFDFVCCSGVLHHTSDAKRGLANLVRVLKPGGQLYLLLYGKEGYRWPTMMAVRPHAQELGYEIVDQAIRDANLPANKQRTFLDDLFVPLIDFYDWDEVQGMLAEHGISDCERWTNGKLDHESSIEVQQLELEQLLSVFDTALKSDAPVYANAQEGLAAARSEVDGFLQRLISDVKEFDEGTIDRQVLEWRIFGWGHHRVLAKKP
ncbi:MAG: hypothetical protein CMJ78_03720 [Planctomycetaceae bacterium]|nr:hypothetical protein [Planctomycetaceae bacterium]